MQHDCIELVWRRIFWQVLCSVGCLTNSQFSLIWRNKWSARYFKKEAKWVWKHFFAASALLFIFRVVAWYFKTEKSVEAPFLDVKVPKAESGSRRLSLFPDQRVFKKRVAMASSNAWLLFKACGFSPGDFNLISRLTSGLFCPGGQKHLKPWWRFTSSPGPKCCLIGIPASEELHSSVC